MHWDIFFVFLGGFTRELFNTGKILDLPGRFRDIVWVLSGEIGSVRMYASDSTVRLIYSKMLWYV